MIFFELLLYLIVEIYVFKFCFVYFMIVICWFEMFMTTFRIVASKFEIFIFCLMLVLILFLRRSCYIGIVLVEIIFCVNFNFIRIVWRGNFVVLCFFLFLFDYFTILASILFIMVMFIFFGDGLLCERYWVVIIVNVVDRECLKLFFLYEGVYFIGENFIINCSNCVYALFATGFIAFKVKSN